MNNPDDCPNTLRLLDWMQNCRVQHEHLNKTIEREHGEMKHTLGEIRAALYGNGREGIMERLKTHSQRIMVIDSDVRDLRQDVDNRLDKLGRNLGEISTRTWKIVVVMAAIVAGLNSILPDIRTIIGL
jgi:hypothetical protein